MPPRVIYPDLPDNWRSRLDVQWPVYTSGRLEALDRAAQAEQNAAGKDVATVRADIRLDAARAFWTLVTATESVTVVEDALKLVEAHLQDVRNMLAVGLVAPNDVLTAEANRSRQQVLLIEARNIRDVAEADLRRATGLGRAVRIDLAAALDGPRPDVPTFDELLAEARKNRPERQALQLRVDGVGQQRAAAAAGSKPVVSVGGGVDYARPNPRIFPRAGAWNESWDVGVNVAWQLWDGGRVKADVAQASASERAAQQRLAEFDTVLEFDVRQRQLDLTSAVAAIAAATAEVASAAEARRVVAERFKAGLASSTDVLDAQQALVGAQLGRTRTLATIKLAQARLDRVLGR
jgi:outer membrane protein TolC